MNIIKNRMTSEAILVLVLKLLLLQGICSVGKAQMETNNGTETSVLLGDFSSVTTRTPDQFLNSSGFTPDATTSDVSTIKAEQTEFSTTQKVSSNSAAPELSSTLAPPSSTTVESSNAEVPPSSATTKLSDAQVPPSSTTAELSSTQVDSSSQMPGLLETTTDMSPTTSELSTTQVTPNTTAAPTTASSSFDAEVATPSENASTVPLDSDNVTDNALKTDKITEADLSPMTTHSNEHYDVETTAFTSMDNATVSLSNDTDNDRPTSSDYSNTQANEMTSLMTQPSDDATTMQSSTDKDTSQTTEFSSSLSSFLSSSSSSSSSSSTTTSSSPSSLPQFSLSSPDRDGPPQPQSQPQEMTFAAKVALVFGVMVGISCVIVVAIVSVRQVLGYWARRDYSNLAQDSMMPFS